LALGHEPPRDLALGQALAEVGQLELVRHRRLSLPRRPDPGVASAAAR
jgi:hypothetical protein